MAVFGRALKAAALGAGVLISAALGLVFPVPPPLLLSARRRVAQTELIRPVTAVVTLDPSEPAVPAWLLDRDPGPAVG